MRSRGAVTVLAETPATAPAAKSAASLGTKATNASGCFKSCAVVGANSLSSSRFSINETQAKPEPPPFSRPLVSHLFLQYSRSSFGVDSTKRLCQGSRPGMSRHTNAARSLLIVVEFEFEFEREKRGEDKANSDERKAVGDRIPKDTLVPATPLF